MVIYTDDFYLYQGLLALHESGRLYYSSPISIIDLGYKHFAIVRGIGYCQVYDSPLHAYISLRTSIMSSRQLYYFLSNKSSKLPEFTKRNLLSSRESIITEWLLAGLPANTIAIRLNISIKTVYSLKFKAMQKLAVKSLAHLAYCLNSLEKWMPIIKIDQPCLQYSLLREKAAFQIRSDILTTVEAIA